MFETYLGKSFFALLFFLYLNMAVFYVQKVNYLNREGCVRHLDFFLKFNSFS